MWYKRRGGEGGCSWGYVPARAYATVSLIISVQYSINFSGCKFPPVSRSYKNMTASRNSSFRTRFENVWWCCFLLWILRGLPRYTVAALNVSFTSFSNSPQFQKLSQNNMRSRICLVLLTPWVHCRITDWKTITLSEFHFQYCTPSRSTDRVPKKLLSFFPDSVS